MGNIFRKKVILDCPYYEYTPRLENDKSVTLPLNNLPPELLDQILKHLDSPELYKCRLVCSIWTRISTDILKTRKELCLTLEFMHDPVSVTEYLEGRRRRKLIPRTVTVKVLHRVFQAVPDLEHSFFPFTQISLADRSLTSPDALQFFAQYGRYIRNLYLFFGNLGAIRLDAYLPVDAAIIEPDMRRLLTTLAPNINTLAVKVASAERPLWDYSPIIFSMTLPELRILFMDLSDYIPGNDRLLGQILAAAPNLAIFETTRNFSSFGTSQSPQNIFSVEYLPTFAAFGQLSLVRRAELNIGESLSTISNPSSQAERTRVLFEILKNSSNSIRHVEFTADPSPIFYDHGHNHRHRRFTNTRTARPILTLPNVRHLRLRLHHALKNLSWMANFDFSRLLPHLSTVYIQVDDARHPAEPDWPFVKLRRPLLSVQQLTVCMANSLWYTAASWMATLSRNFPRVKRLELLQVDVFGPPATPLWTLFTRLHHLSLEIHILQGYSTSSLNAFFSGFNEDDCWTYGDTKVAKSVRDVAAELLLKKSGSRRNPSILKLKDLVQLNVRMKGLHIHHNKVPSLLSHVPTGKLTFGQMPHLAVTISIAGVRVKSAEGEEKVNAALQSSMGPFANLEFCTFSRKCDHHHELHQKLGQQNCVTMLAYDTQCSQQ